MILLTLFSFLHNISKNNFGGTMKPLIAYYDGRVGSPEEITVPISDRSLFFGDAVYDAALVKDGNIFLAEEHVERLLNGAKRLKIEHKFTAESISTEIKRFAKASGKGVHFLYFQLSRRSEGRTHSYLYADGAALLMTLSKANLPCPDKTLSLISVPDTRYLHCDVKTVNLLPAVMASGYAEENGADEAVFVRDGIVTECAHSNVSILKDGTLYTHPLTNRILPGITRKHLISYCERSRIPVKEIPFTFSELEAADEVIVSSTTKLCVRATFLDKKPVGGKNTHLADKICSALFDEFVHYS